MITAASRLPWWVCILLAIISFFVLHTIASRPIAIAVTNANQLGNAAMRGMGQCLAGIGQYVLPLAFSVAAIVSLVKRSRRRQLYVNTQSRNTVSALHEMDWHDFERLVEEFYRRKGFLVTRDSVDGPDGGIDLILHRDRETYLVQCKKWKAYKIGVQQVREFYGIITARGAAGGYFVTSGTYTDDAKAFANGTNLELIDGVKLRWMIATTQNGQVTAKRSTELGPTLIHSAPACPTCGKSMTKRVARQGGSAGKEFWGCTAFPRCSGTRPLDEHPRP